MDCFIRGIGWVYIAEYVTAEAIGRCEWDSDLQNLDCEASPRRGRCAVPDLIIADAQESPILPRPLRGGKFSSEPAGAQSVLTQTIVLAN